MKRPVFYMLLILTSLVMLLPFVWTLYASLVKNDMLVNHFPTSISEYGFENFMYIITQSHIATWYKNSLFVTITITVGNLLFNSMAGYSLARIKFPGSKILFFVTLGIMMVPIQILLIPIFIMMATAGWINTYLALIIPFLVNPFGVFLMRQFFVTFPKELEESAKVDGLNRISIFFRIALPLAKPALIAQAIFIFVWNWNSFPFPSILATEPEMYTLPVGIYQITNTAYTSSITASMAGVVLMTIPTIVFFMIFQKYFISSSIGSGIKG
ncbi:carbohydrate ABC transporter permease [Texcoconibacillus texcoconensis]|uniref:Multiple sugar transport system permease protein n=1 Tax=Texcoconibacillus texcoconensis TaxID=1095777 RepID=A0A840QRE4_9BACI|nr:carbohydrate ABC transporter permease [Texcoconibacillus texcoconensis]MBB5173891.1 multiple sugar transport system permease protein [Texcoconibacillus texcoconensis]